MLISSRQEDDFLILCSAIPDLRDDVVKGRTDGAGITVVGGGGGGRGHHRLEGRRVLLTRWETSGSRGCQRRRRRNLLGVGRGISGAVSRGRSETASNAAATANRPRGSAVTALSLRQETVKLISATAATTATTTRRRLVGEVSVVSITVMVGRGNQVLNENPIVRRRRGLKQLFYGGRVGGDGKSGEVVRGSEQRVARAASGGGGDEGVV